MLVLLVQELGFMHIDAYLEFPIDGVFIFQALHIGIANLLDLKELSVYFGQLHLQFINMILVVTLQTLHKIT